MNNLTTTQNKDIVLSKNRAILNIASKILSSDSLIHKEVVEEWIREIWEWADANGLDDSLIPRDKSLLLSLSKIELSFLGLESFTRGLCFLENVKTLDLSQNNIQKLPKEIINFRDLTLLNLKSNPFTLNQSQHIWINQLKEKGCEVYTDFELVEKQSNEIADENWMQVLWDWADENDIPDLEWVESGQYKGLPRDEEKLLSLTKLLLDKNQITELPKEIGNLVNLTVIWLHENQIAEVPKEIANLSNLTLLSLSNNQIKELPKEIGNLTNLTELSLWGNQIIELPKEIGNLTNLTTLSLSSNQITELPKEIGNLTNLTILRLSNNQITELPKEIGNLTNLTDLWLDYNQITELPKEIGNLTNLTDLWLDYNQITELPKEIGNLTNLTYLLLNDNQITELPKEIGNLTNLTILRLSNNQITELPIEIGKLTNLTKLLLSGNQRLFLTSEQKIWLKKFKENGCDISLYNDDFLYEEQNSNNYDDIPF